MAKIKTSFSLSAECLKLLKAMAEKKGLSQAAIIETLTRSEAKKEKIAA